MSLFKITFFLALSGLSFVAQAMDYSSAMSAALASAHAYADPRGLLVGTCYDDIANHRVICNITLSNGNYYANSIQAYDETPCPAPGVLTNHVCVAPCPSGQVPASSVPALGTTLNTCVNPTDQKCNDLGVDVNSFIAKCSEMIDGTPTQCRNSDMTAFQLQGCPKLKCADGSETTYPTPCPVAACEPGFTLSDVPGYGKTCIKPLPDDEQQNPCVNVQGSDSALCANDGKNCQMVNGAFVCIKEEVQPIPGATCYTINSKNYCLSNQPTLETTKGTETLPDGSTRTTETYAPSVQGVNPSKRVTTTAPDGTSTTISNHPSDVAAAAGLATQTVKVDLGKVEKNTLDTANNTKDIKDKLTDLFKTDDLGNPQNEEHAVLGSHATLVDGITDAPQLDIGGLASPSSWWSLPDNQCFGQVDQTIFGKQYTLAPCDKLAPLREILAYFLYLTTAWQIFNIAFKTKEG